jgi:hypothetical protein
MSTLPPLPPLSPGDMDLREQALKQDGYLLGIAILSLVNGMHFSPWYDLMLVPVAALSSSFWISSQLIIFYLTSLVLSLITVIIAGIPAALYERAMGLAMSNVRSLQLWMLATAIVAAPAFMRMFGF